MILSPLSTRHVALGQLIWTGLRVTFGAAIFVAVMAAFGAVAPGRAPLLLPVAALTGLAFAAPIQAFAASQRNDNPFASLFRFVITPMFIFSGTFFPVSELPDLLQVVAYLTPLWHGVALARMVALDMVDPALAAINVAYLSAFVVVGMVASFHTFGRKLAE
jgi:lipooligosaccharide transport system permease protein